MSKFKQVALGAALAVMALPVGSVPAAAQEAGVCVTVYEIDLIIVRYEVKVCDSTGTDDGSSGGGAGGGGGGAF